MSERRYGYFRCPNCNAQWESSHVYCHPGTFKVAYKQECKKCKIAVNPYRVEKITCSVCGQQDCRCTREDKRKRHVDPNKPHRADLCLKCKAGKPCQNRS